MMQFCRAFQTKLKPQRLWYDNKTTDKSATWTTTIPQCYASNQTKSISMMIAHQLFNMQYTHVWVGLFEQGKNSNSTRLIIHIKIVWVSCYPSYSHIQFFPDFNSWPFSALVHTSCLYSTSFEMKPIKSTHGKTYKLFPWPFICKSHVP